MAAESPEGEQPAPTTDKTRLDAAEIEDLPTARNLWAFLESVVPGVVTDRVDTGGLRGDTPARFGGFGTSWTQNGTFLNGLNLTDPYSGDRPLLFPDIDALAAIDVSTAAGPASLPVPGIAVLLDPRRGGDRFQGAFRLFGEGDRTQGDNVSAAKRELGVTSPEHFGNSGSGSLQLGGPIVPGRASFFLSASGVDFSRFPQNTSASAASSLRTGFLDVTADLGEHRAQLLWATQEMKNPNAGLSARVSPSATLDERDVFDVVQLVDSVALAPALTLESRLGLVSASLRGRLQAGVSEHSRLELFQGDLAGAAPLATTGDRRRIAFDQTLGGQLSARRLLGLPFPSDTGFSAGISYEEISSSSEQRALGDLDLQYFGGKPFAAVLFDGPARTRQRLRHLALFVQTRTALGSRLAIDAGLRLQSSRGWLPDAETPAVSWTTLSPRLAASVRLGARTTVRAGFSRYYHQLLGSVLDFGDPNALGGKVVLWNDRNGNGQPDPGELGTTLRVFGGGHSGIDPALKPPYTDEVLLGADFALGPFAVAITAMQRYEQRLLAAIDVGVPFSAYRPVTIHDIGGDGIPDTWDDQDIVVYNQDPATLGKNSYLLTNPQGLRDFYQGVEIVARIATGVRGLWGQLSFDAYRIVGMASQEGESQVYDQGVVGNLYHDPNTLINADGRLFFDRAFAAKAAWTYALPRGFLFSGVARYWDGLPFGRKLVVTGMNQGPFYVFATPRGNDFRPSVSPGGHRTQYYLTLDLGLEKRLPVAGGSLGARIDVFNVLDANQNTIENDLSAADFQSRRPIENQAPRVFRFGLSYEF